MRRQSTSASPPSAPAPSAPAAEARCRRPRTGGSWPGGAGSAVIATRWGEMVTSRITRASVSKNGKLIGSRIADGPSGLIVQRQNATEIGPSGERLTMRFSGWAKTWPEGEVSSGIGGSRSGAMPTASTRMTRSTPWPGSSWSGAFDQVSETSSRRTGSHQPSTSGCGRTSRVIGGDSMTCSNQSLLLSRRVRWWTKGPISSRPGSSGKSAMRRTMLRTGRPPCLLSNQ